MAIRERKTNGVKKNKSSKMYGDRDLMDVLNAGRKNGKKNFTYRQGNSIIPVIEPLVIEKKPAKKVKNQKAAPDKLTYDEVHVNTENKAKNIPLDPELVKEQKEKARNLTKRKFIQTFLTIAVVLISGIFVMLLLFPQTELSEISRDNSNLKDQINTVKREIVNAEENANGVADMDVIRARAIALGMQDPNMNQVISLPIPNTDSLKTRINYNSDGINEEAFKDSKDALADYYAAHPDK